MTAQDALPYAIPGVIIALVLFRLRPGVERELHPIRMWIAPALAVALLSSALIFSPHHHYGMLQYTVVATSIVGGIVVGLLRSRSLQMRHHEGRVLISTSNAAFVFIVVLIVARQLMKHELAAAGLGISLDAPLAFALAMIVTGRLTLWRRAQALRAGA